MEFETFVTQWFCQHWEVTIPRRPLQVPAATRMAPQAAGASTVFRDEFSNSAGIRSSDSVTYQSHIFPWGSWFVPTQADSTQSQCRAGKVPCQADVPPSLSTKVSWQQNLLLLCHKGLVAQQRSSPWSNSGQAALRLPPIQVSLLALSCWIQRILLNLAEFSKNLTQEFSGKPSPRISCLSQSLVCFLILHHAPGGISASQWTSSEGAATSV